MAPYLMTAADIGRKPFDPVLSGTRARHTGQRTQPPGRSSRCGPSRAAGANGNLDTNAAHAHCEFTFINEEPTC